MHLENKNNFIVKNASGKQKILTADIAMNLNE